jgi:hypothetical protein
MPQSARLPPKPIRASRRRLRARERFAKRTMKTLQKKPAFEKRRAPLQSK